MPPDDEERKRMGDELRSLMGEYKEMTKRIRGSSTVDQSSMDLPYSAEVMVVPLLPKFRAPQIEMYEGSKDLAEHLEMFKIHMTLHGFHEKIACWAFPLMLKGSAWAWFGSLWLCTIHNFEKLGRQFFTQFMASLKRRRLAAYLFTVKQRKEESLKEYLYRFNK